MTEREDAVAIDAAARLLMVMMDRPPDWRPTARCGRTDPHGAHTVPVWCVGNLEVLEGRPQFASAIERIAAFTTDGPDTLDEGYVIGAVSCAARAFLDDDRSEDPYLAQASVVLDQVVDVERNGQNPQEAADVLTSAIDDAEGLFDPILGPYSLDWYD